MYSIVVDFNLGFLAMYFHDIQKEKAKKKKKKRKKIQAIKVRVRKLKHCQIVSIIITEMTLFETRNPTII